MDTVTQVSVGKVGVFKGAVSLALQDGFLTNGEKRMLVKLSHTLRLDEDEPKAVYDAVISGTEICLLYTSPSPRDRTRSRMPSSA